VEVERDEVVEKRKVVSGIMGWGFVALAFA